MTLSTLTPNAKLRKSSIIDQELDRLNIDIAALQETRLLGFGSVAEKNYTFFWKGKNDGEKQEHCVAFAVRKSILPFTEPPTDGNKHMISMKLHTNLGVVSLINIYAPTIQASTEEIDVFYTQLDQAVTKIPKSKQLFILGDFNARVGKDVLSWSPHIGCFGVGKLNSNGRRLLEFTALHNLCINTFYGISFRRRVSWCHPRSKDWHQLNHIVTRRSFLSNVSLTRSFHSADCDTDHAPLCSIVKLKPKKVHRSKQPGKARINTSNTINKDKQHKFQSEFQKNLLNSRHTDNLKWQNISKVIHSAAIQTFGIQIPKTKDWYVDSATVLNPLRDIK
ncbi:craniofacial development protein 2-like [Anneissia japonica]|uniref:craniofacial development protein 2-like n=1 Tax=Anneissia japonica TaxID=1529436 RepID=UPI001425786A|nr:craniofacial development protein 2-like [Anneissia japonica]